MARGGLITSLSGNEMLELSGPSGQTTTGSIAQLASGGGAGSSTPVAIYGDLAVDNSGQAVFVLDQESPAGEVDGVVCAAGTVPDRNRVTILQDGLYSVTVQGDLFGASLTGGSVILGIHLGPGMPSVASKYNEGAVQPTDTEYGAVWSEVWPVKAGGYFDVNLSESGTATSRAAVLVIVKIS